MFYRFFGRCSILLLVLAACAPGRVGRIGIFPDTIRGVALVGNHAYLAVEGRGLGIVDVSDPARPREVGFHATPGDAYDLAVSGNTAYIADGESGVFIIDVSDPAHPVEAGSYETPGNVFGLAISGDLLYVANFDNGLRILDVSNPANPKEVGFYNNIYPLYVRIEGHTAYILDTAISLRIMDISNPVRPIEVGWVNYLGYPTEIEVVGNYAYVTSQRDGLHIVDISNPPRPEPGAEGVSPTIVGSYYSRGDMTSQAFTLAGPFALLADGPNGLRVIDVSDAVNPQLIGSSDTPGSASDVVVVEDIAYVADGDRGLRMIDISDPVNPGELGFYERRGLAGNMALIDYTQWIFTLVGISAALFVHWLSWLARLHELSVAVGFGLVVVFILIVLSAAFMFLAQGSGADGAYMLQALLMGLWAVLLPCALAIGTLQARALLAPWWKGVLSTFFEAGLAFLTLAAFNYALQHFVRVPETGLIEGDYMRQATLSCLITLLALAVFRPIIRLSTTRRVSITEKV